MLRIVPLCQIKSCLVSAGLLLILISASFHVQAQRYPHLANPKDWQYVISDHFDIYYSGDLEALAQKTAKYAELARYEVGNLYDFTPEDRYTIFLAPDLNRQVLTHNAQVYESQESGVFPLPEKSEMVVYPGSNRALYQEVKRAVSHLVLKEFSFGKRLGGALQNQMLLSHTPWYVQGMTDYVGQGWSYRDEMWLNNISSEDLLQLALEGESYLSRVVRKSIWHYIGHEYGDQKLAEIIYLVHISHSMESGVISVLGVTLNTLTDRWREYIRNRIASNGTGRTPLGQLQDLKEIPLRPGQEIISFAYNEPRDLMALYLNEKGKHVLYFYDFNTQKLSPAGIHSSFSNFSSEGKPTFYPLAWSKDGRRLVTTRQQGHSYELAFADLDGRKVEYLPLESLDRILHIDWSHNGQLLALSAMKAGRTDIYLGKPGDNVFTPITQDEFDDLEPSWSFDDQSLFFSSNRDTFPLKANEIKREAALRNSFDLFQYNREEGTQRLIRITQTPEINERQPIAPNSFEVVYLSDETGIPNLNKINIFLKEASYVTDLGSGIQQYQVTENKLVFSTPAQGKPGLFSVDLSAVPSPNIPQLTLTRMEFLAAYNEARKRAEAEAQRKLEEELLKETTPQDTLPAEKQEEPEKEKAKEGREKPVRYYIFDEEEEPYQIKKRENDFFEKRQRDLIRPGVKPLKVEKKVSFRDFEVSTGGAAPNPWSADRVILALGRRPDAGYYAAMGARFTDRLHTQQVEARITPFIAFNNFAGRNGQAVLRYENTRNRIDWYGEAEGFIRHYRRENTLFPPLDSAIYRYSMFNAKAGIRFPLSAFSHVMAEGSFFQLSRTDQKLLNQSLAHQQDQILRAGIGYGIDRVKERQGFAYAGFAAQASFFTAYSLPQSAIAFHTANLGIRGYQKVYKDIVLAAQVRSSVSFGERQQQQYLGGIDDWIIPIFFEENNPRDAKENSLNTDLLDYSFQSFATPVRGFWFFTRGGSKFATLNTELRIPLSRIWRQALNSSSIYSIEVIPFLDVGSVWTSGVPFSQKNPTDTQVLSNGPVTVELQTLKSPFVFGFGSGFRTNFLGYSVRMDLAWGIDDNTLQKPVLSIAMGKNF